MDRDFLVLGELIGVQVRSAGPIVRDFGGSGTLAGPIDSDFPSLGELLGAQIRSTRPMDCDLCRFLRFS